MSSCSSPWPWVLPWASVFKLSVPPPPRLSWRMKLKAHFGDLVRGEVERFPVPNLRAFNFILHDSLGGGGTESLKTDAQGKTHGQGLLQLEIDVPEELLPS
ncbi:MAG: hypothetical protein AAFY88_28540 [Acidobacteriota bacterium]